MKKTAKKLIPCFAAVLLLLALAGCGEQKKYDEAKALYDAGDYRAAANIFEELGTYEDSATMLQSCEYELTTDRQFIHALSKGLHERWILAAKNTAAAETVTVDGEELRVGDDYSPEVYIEAELDDLIEYKTAVFADKELQKKALAYIAALEEGVEAEKYANVDYAKYYEMTDTVYADRAVLLADFYNNYGLQVAAEDAATMKNFLDTADAVLSQRQEEEAAALAQQQKIEEIKALFVNNFKYTTEIEAKYGGYYIKLHYTFENSSAFDIDNLYVEFHYFNDEGYKTNQMTNLNEDVRAGDSVRGEREHSFSFDTKPTGTVKISKLEFSVDGIRYTGGETWFE